jgi:membrane associated rhomboid family serine protease
MGIHDRDYYRDDSPSWTWGRWGVTVWLIVITAAVFLLQMIGRDVSGAARGDPITDFGVCDKDRILRGEVWRLITPVFLHAGLWHLAFNMLVLYWAGSRMEERYGSREFLLFYLTAGVLGNVAYVASQVAGITPPAVALGASGAVTAVFVLFACYHPHQTVLFMFIIPMPVWLLVILYVAFDALGFLSGRGGIGYAAHLGGAAFGFAYYWFGWRVAALIPGGRGRSRVRAGPRLRVLPPEPDEEPDDDRQPVAAAIETPRPGGDEPFETKVDRVLEKVSQYGQESLTPEEREILFRASEVYKKRRK